MNPRLLTARTRMGFTARKLAGLCPLTAAELVRYFKKMSLAQKLLNLVLVSKHLQGGVAIWGAAQFGMLHTQKEVYGHWRNWCTYTIQWVWLC
jgi:hypothetical protein